MRGSPLLHQLKMAAQLAPLAEVERLSPRCIRILGGNPGKFTLQGTNTYLLGTGRQRLLVDTGEGRASWGEALRRTLDAEKATVAHALLTHWHEDHTRGVGQLLELAPEAKVYKNDPDGGQLDLADGQNFGVEGATVRAVHTPGHTTDHMVLVFEEENAMFTGDNVLGQGTAVFEDLGIYLRSLATMMTLFNGRAYPGHGPVIENGPAKIQEYISHRAQREDQVFQALKSKKPDAATSNSSWQSMELVKVIYWDVPEELHPAAERGVLQILGKLLNEGKVVKDEAGWRVKGRSPL
jgi:endoribonuclease LACTB2